MAGISKEQQVEAFNIEHPVGSPVTVLLDSGEFRDTTVRAPAQVLSGHTPVVWLDGITGCYALHRVTGYSQDRRQIND